MIELIKIISSCTGINNKIEPKRLNETDLAEGVNIEVDDSGQIMSRLGQVIISAVSSHSAYCNKGAGYVVQDRSTDTAIYQIARLTATTFSLTGVRSGLEKGARVSFWQVGAKTYYMNGVQSGVIEAGASAAWPTNAHVGVDSSTEYYPAPLGTHIAVFQGRMYIVVGSVVYVSEPYAYGKFAMSKCFFNFQSDVTMIKPVKGGIWVSDSEQTGFIASAEKFEQMSWIKRTPFPAHEWSENIELVDFSQSALQIPGLSAVWSSNEGKCIGTEDGQLLIPTKEKLIYPTGGSGATVVDGNNVINSVY